MKTNDTLLMFWKLDARCFLCSPDTYMASDNTQCSAVGYRLTKHNLADVRDPMVLISVDNLWKYKYGSDLAIFPALAIFPSSTLLSERCSESEPPARMHSACLPRTDRMFLYAVSSAQTSRSHSDCKTCGSQAAQNTARLMWPDSYAHISLRQLGHFLLHTHTQAVS
jgi:hypothetical protein